VEEDMGNLERLRKEEEEKKKSVMWSTRDR
jgi:hypothetical protein